jgi:quercetin dioxygenase-like cupin family protein
MLVEVLIRTTSPVRSPLASSNCFPSSVQEKSKISPELKFVTGRASPPANRCSQTFVAPIFVRASTGWHTHPGPVFITVTQGEVTFYEVDDPTCSPTVVKAGEGYVDTGHGHIGRNENGNPARDIAVVIAPVGGAFRSELPAPGPYCAF